MKNKSKNWWLLSAGLFFVLFLINMFTGKIALAMKAKPWLALGDVGEFLLLLVAVICFVIAVLQRENHETDKKNQAVNGLDEEIL